MVVRPAGIVRRHITEGEAAPPEPAPAKAARQRVRDSSCPLGAALAGRGYLFLLVEDLGEFPHGLCSSNLCRYESGFPPNVLQGLDAH